MWDNLKISENLNINFSHAWRDGSISLSISKVKWDLLTPTL